MSKKVRKKVVKVFAIAMLIAGMYSCSSDDDNNEYKEVSLSNDLLNGNWYRYDTLDKEGKSIIDDVRECIKDNYLTFTSKELKYEVNEGKSACEDEDSKPGEILETATYQTSNVHHTITITNSEGGDEVWEDVKVSKKGKKLQLEFKNSEGNNDESDTYTYIFHKE